MSLYDELAGVAAEILNDPDFKQGVTTIVKLTAGTGPAYDPGPATSAETILSGSVTTGVTQKYLKSSLVVETDLIVTYPALGNPAPDMNDFMKIDSVSHKIVEIHKVPPAGTTVVWKTVVRKG